MRNQKRTQLAEGGPALHRGSFVLQPLPHRIPRAINRRTKKQCSPILEIIYDAARKPLESTNQVLCFQWSGRGDLNARPPAPKAGALPGCATPRHLTDSFDSKPLLDSPHSATRTETTRNRPDRVKTVPKPHQLGLSVSKLRLLSFACRFSFCRASRFIWSFICEYFLKTLASPCRSNCVTHSSATPPALRRVAYVERRS